jgi:uncharacterized protein
VTAGKEEGQVPRLLQWQEPAANAPSHRILAIRRGEKGFLTLRIIAPEEALACSAASS